MTDKSDHFPITRRDLLGALAASVVPRKYLPPAAIADPGNITAAMAQQFYENPKYLPLLDWLGTLYDSAFDTKDDLQFIRLLESQSEAITESDLEIIALKIAYRGYHSRILNESLWECGLRLIDNPPSPELIEEIFFHPVFQASHDYPWYLDGQSPEQAVQRYTQFARMCEKDLEEILSKRIVIANPTLNRLEALGRAHPVISEKIKQLEARIQSEQPPKNPRAIEPAHGFPDAAAARKAAMYPIPENISQEERMKLGIGLHATPYALSCEHYGTISSRDDQLRTH